MVTIKTRLTFIICTFLKFAADNIPLITCLQSRLLLFTIFASSRALKIERDMVWDGGWCWMGRRCAMITKWYSDCL